MHHSDEQTDHGSIAGGEQRDIDAVVARGPGGAFAVAGIASFLVVAMFFLFYFLVYLPRGAIQ